MDEKTHTENARLYLTNSKHWEHQLLENMYRNRALTSLTCSFHCLDATTEETKVGFRTCTSRLPLTFNCMYLKQSLKSVYCGTPYEMRYHSSNDQIDILKIPVPTTSYLTLCKY